MDNDGEDPFAWISTLCHISSSQEEFLRKAPFVLPNLAPGDHGDDDNELVVILHSPVECSRSREEEDRRAAESHEVMDYEGGAQEEAVDMAMAMEKTPDDSSLPQEEILWNAPFVLPNLAPGDHEDDELVVISDSQAEVSRSRADEFWTVPITQEVMNGGGGAQEELMDCGGGAQEEEVVIKKNLCTEGLCRLNTASDILLLDDEEMEDVDEVHVEEVRPAAGLPFRKLPPSFDTGYKGDGGMDTTRQGCGSGEGTCAAEKLRESTDDELTDNILKVLDFLAKKQKRAHEEKVDILVSAIKAGVTFPRPSWWPEGGEDDDASN